MQTESLATLVAEFEKRLPEAQKNIGEVFATLRANYGPDNKRDRPPLFHNGTPIMGALIAVLEHYEHWKERAQAAEAWIIKKDKYTKVSQAYGEMDGPEKAEYDECYQNWKNIVFNQNLRKEFAE